MKSILVHLDASPRAAERLALARALARLHGAELTTAYAVLPSVLASPWVAMVEDSSVAALMQDIDNVQRGRARALFDSALGGADARWIDAGAAAGTDLIEPVQQLARLALYADLVVAGQHDARDLLAGVLPASLVPDLIVDSGKPVLVVPYAGNFEADPRTVLIAWKPTREAARAVGAALPWLLRARRIVIATGGHDEDDESALPALEHWLHVQGAGATIESRRILAEDVGEDLLSIAADTGAGLLAMGCYGHRRTREWVLGGVTRTVLRSMTVPVLMAH